MRPEETHGLKSDSDETAVATEPRNPRPQQEALLAETLAAFDQGARLLEEAYRELWATRTGERTENGLAASERIRDLCHEIKNPLGGVRGLVSLLESELQKSSPTDRACRLLQKITSGLDILAGIVQERGELSEALADAGAVAEEAAGLALAEDRAGGGNVRFQVDAPAGIELPLSTSSFRRVLLNLLRNAAQACGDRGVVKLCVESGLDRVEVSIADDGCGFPPVPEEELMRRGFSTKGVGRGRGLALVREIVDEVGGEISFDRLEKGSLVRVQFPRG